MRVCRVAVQIHVRLQRYDIDALPEDDEGVAAWCRDLFIAKVTPHHARFCIWAPAKPRKKPADGHVLMLAAHSFERRRGWGADF